MLVAKPKGEASNRDALSFRVGMYVCMYICISADCTMQFYAFNEEMHYIIIIYNYTTKVKFSKIKNSMLMYVYLQRLHNTILCSRMYVRLALLPKTITALDYCLACVARILWKNATKSVSSPCSAHCTSRTISVTL